MALSIKDEEADKLARKLAALTNTTITQAVVDALRIKIAHEERQRDSAQIVRDVMEMAQNNRENMLRQGIMITSTDDDDLYDEMGLPK